MLVKMVVKESPIIGTMKLMMMVIVMEIPVGEMKVLVKKKS